MENCKGRRRKRDRASSPSNKTVTTEQIASHNFPKVAKTEAKELPAEKSSSGLLLDGENSGPLTLDLQKFVHARVVKKTNGELRFGVVESYCRQKDENPIKEAADASWLFSVQYDDGSKETLSTSDLQESLQLCQKSDAFKGKYISDGPQCLAVPLANEIPPSRVAKYFGDDLYFGDLSSRNSHGFYEVRYDDGDSEEWDGSEVSLGIALCNEHVENHTRDLWAIYDLDAKQMKKRWSLASKAPLNCWPRSFVTNAPTVVKFYLFVMERQRSWIRRKTQRMQHPERWTNDRVFRDYYFCNVYRQLDRGTAYFRSQILDLWSESSPEDLDILRGEWFVRVLWASYCYRLVNKIESFQKDPDSHDPMPTTKFDGIPTIQQWPKFKALVKRAKDDGKVLFTSAHQTCGFDRYTEQLDIVHGEQTRLQYVAAQSESLESCFLAISKQLPGCGPFLAWQILCDLVESNCLDEVPDVDFCVLGKGAKGKLVVVLQPTTRIERKSALSQHAFHHSPSWDSGDFLPFSNESVFEQQRISRTYKAASRTPGVCVCASQGSRISDGLSVLAKSTLDDQGD